MDVDRLSYQVTYFETHIIPHESRRTGKNTPVKFPFYTVFGAVPCSSFAVRDVPIVQYELQLTKRAQGQRSGQFQTNPVKIMVQIAIDFALELERPSL